MSLARRLFAAHPSNPPQWLVEMFGGAPSATGIAVTPDSAEQVAAVFACVRVIAETLGSLPLHLYRELPGGGKERVTDRRIAEVLGSAPNPWQTPSEFKELLTSHSVLRGQGAAQIVYRNNGEIEMLVPLHPARLTYRNDPGDGRVVCDYRPKSGTPRTFELWELFRITANSTDGITGRSPIEVAREAVALALAAEKFGASFFGEGARPAGILTHPRLLSPEAKKNLKEDWQRLYGGVAGQNRMAVLEEGLTYTQVGMKLDDAQFLETRKYQTTEIARLFRVPPHMIADLERSTNNNIEHQGIEFDVYTMMPWYVRWEQAVKRDLLTAEEVRERMYAKIRTAGLLRGDTKSRYEAYGIARNWGWMCVNDIRELEDQNPLDPEIGEVYLQPSNMVPAGTNPAGVDTRSAATAAQLVAAQRDLVADALRRGARRAAQVRKGNPALEGHAEFVAGVVAPALQAFADLFAVIQGLDPAKARESAAIFARQRALAAAELSTQLEDPEAHDWPTEAESWLRDLTTVLLAHRAPARTPVPA